MLAVRTVVGGAVWGGPEEKQELGGYILTSDSSGGKRLCLDSAVRHSRSSRWRILGTSMLRPQLTTLTPQGSLREERALEWMDFESLNPALSNIQLYSIAPP